jgi:hypothetical protein
MWEALLFHRSPTLRDRPPPPVKGYITAVNPTTGFDVNREHVKVLPGTHFGILGGLGGVYDDALRDKVRVGTYVQVMHARRLDDKATNTVTADEVLLRDDWNEEPEGMGVIDRVVSTGAEPVFQADGYRIRITSATEISYAEGLKTLGDVGTNTWLRYEGKRDEAGVLVASKARFFPAKLILLKRALMHESWDMSPKPVGNSERGPNSPPMKQGNVLNADGSLNQDAEVQYGGYQFNDDAHRIPMDPPLQERVRRVGMSVVPAYQKLLPDDDPSKIHFRFYAVEDEKNRAAICSYNGIIYIPTQILQRLRSNDQLAAVLADGVAYNLQRQAAKMEAGKSTSILGYYAGDVVAANIPGIGVQTAAGGGINTPQTEEQRGRVALALMADAGYDPWQAPEAWRLLAPKKLPKDLDSLKYPDRSGYQLRILNLQYREKAAGESTGAVPTVSAGK